MFRGKRSNSSGEVPIARADGRWRRAQSARRRVLTARGRLTLLGLAMFGVGLVGWLTDPFAPFRVPSASAYAALPQVAAAAPPAAQAGRASTRVPDAILNRLPISRETLDELLRAAPERQGLVEWVDAPLDGARGTLRVEYTLHGELMQRVFQVLERGRVALGTVVVLDPTSGRVIAYASTDPQRFSPTNDYPAASLVKVITAATALGIDPETANLPCRYRGDPYRLDRRSIDPPAVGRTISLRRALATSNNKCFAQLAVHAVGPLRLMEALDRFGWLSAPAHAHAPGSASLGDARYDLGLLGSGLDGARITPLHAAQLAASLVHGELVPPRWIERVVGANEGELPLPPVSAPRRILSDEITRQMRSMLVETTRSGTARRAFRDERGRPLLGEIEVAGKTGSLSGRNPDGRYEWFVGVAPADRPQIAIATVLVQGHLWWRNSAEIAAEVLRRVFCSQRVCRPEHASRFVSVPDAAVALAEIGPDEMAERGKRARLVVPPPLLPYHGD